ELAPSQRTGLTAGLPFSALTPPQQMLFLQFAQRWRPYVEPWRFQHGAFRLAPLPKPPPEAGPNYNPWQVVSREEIQVSFQEDDAQSFPVDLFARREQPGVVTALSDWVGKSFPFPLTSPVRSQDDEDASWKPALVDRRLRHRAELILIFRPFVNPYVGTVPPSMPANWARALAKR